MMELFYRKSENYFLRVSYKKIQNTKSKLQNISLKNVNVCVLFLKKGVLGNSLTSPQATF